jgi:mannonate dehydratase
LGGASRDGVLVYGHASGNDIEDTAKSVGEYLALGTRRFARKAAFRG